MPEYRLGRLKGRFVVTWDDAGTRRRYRLKASTDKEAKAEAIDVIRAKTPAPASETVADLWQAYRHHLGDRPTGKTMEFTGKAVLPFFGALRPDHITIAHCREYVALRIAAGKHVGTIWTELGHLSSCLSWAKKTRLIAHKPYIELPKKPAPKERYLTHAEIDRLLSAARESAPHVNLATVLLLTTAARIGAILDLTWDRIDFDRGQINLRLDQVGPRKGRAVVPMNPMARAALTTAKAAAMTEFVVEYAGGRIASLKKAFGRAVERAGLEGVTPHVLRHTAGVHMAGAGVDMERISQIMGHTSIATTRRIYARFAPEYLADAAEVLNFAKVKKVQ